VFQRHVDYFFRREIRAEREFLWLATHILQAIAAALALTAVIPEQGIDI
jgi:hypothetical protein